MVLAIRKFVTWPLRRRLASRVMLALIACPNVNGTASTIVAASHMYADKFYGVL